MISKLPPWVEVGGFALSVIAGSVNAIGLLGFKHQAVSHLTGSSTLLGLEMANGDLGASLHLVLILLSFVLGATLSGLVVKSAALKLGRRYGVALLLEAGLLLLAMLTLNRGSDTGHLLASAACGLQNAMASTYSGAVIRTTHVSGLFTDLGVMLGAWLRGLPVDGRRLKLYLFLIGGFILGGSLGSLAYRAYAFSSLALPAGIALLMATVYWIYWYLDSRRHAAARALQ
ncbi:MAG: DUF1275 domain-containing protein [Gammaproteobacteria bacterium]|nr:DUF1275 domain-containing protein [Gammaproteobacteria bacterium]